MADYLYMFQFQNGAFYIGRDLGSSSPYKRATDHMQGALSSAFPTIFDPLFLKAQSNRETGSISFKLIQTQSIQKIDQEWGRWIKKRIDKAISNNMNNKTKTLLQTGNLIMDSTSIMGEMLINNYSDLVKNPLWSIQNNINQNNLIMTELSKNDLTNFGPVTWYYIDLDNNNLYNQFNYEYKGKNKDWKKPVTLNLFYTLSKLTSNMAGFGKGDVAKLAEFLITSWYLTNSNNINKILNNKIGDVKFIVNEKWFTQFQDSLFVKKDRKIACMKQAKSEIRDYIIKKIEKKYQKNNTGLGRIVATNISHDTQNTKGILTEYELPNNLLKEELGDMITFLLNKFFQDKTIKNYWKEDTKNMLLTAWDNVQYNQKQFNYNSPAESLKWNIEQHKMRTTQVFDNDKWINNKKEQIKNL